MKTRNETWRVAPSPTFSPPPFLYTLLYKMQILYNTEGLLRADNRLFAWLTPKIRKKQVLSANRSFSTWRCVHLLFVEFVVANRHNVSTALCDPEIRCEFRINKKDHFRVQRKTVKTDLCRKHALTRGCFIDRARSNRCKLRSVLFIKNYTVYRIGIALVIFAVDHHSR